MVTGLVAAMVALVGPPARAAGGSSQTTVGIVVTGAPALAVTKRGIVVDVHHDGRIDTGDLVRWTITVSNTGDTMLTGLTVSDPEAGPARCPTTPLVPKQVVTCAVPDHVITFADVAAGVVTNVATASATAPGGQVVSPPGSASVRIQGAKPAVIFLPPPGVFGFPAAPGGRPGSDEPAVGGAAAGGAGSGGGAGIGSGSGPGAAGPGSPNSQGGLPSSAEDQQRAHPPVAVAGGQPDAPGHGGLTLVLLGAITAAGALASLGVLASRRTRRRR
ncbi:DUF7507 domain-containing protein [Frankia canadensis]|nr:hypothetical protein [Frankia canadensis]